MENLLLLTAACKRNDGKNSTPLMQIPDRTQRPIVKGFVQLKDGEYAATWTGYILKVYNPWLVTGRPKINRNVLQIFRTHEMVLKRNTHVTVFVYNGRLYLSSLQRSYTGNEIARQLKMFA